MSNKTLAILSYITIIGWIIAFVKGKELNPKSDLVNYHLKQGLGFFIIGVVVNIILTIIVSIVPSLYFLTYVGIIFFVLWIFGIINAVNEEKRPLPVIGKMFEDKFSFIN